MSKYLKANGVTPRQERAIEELLNQPNISAAARECGVPTRTMYRWLKDETFQRAVESKRRRQPFERLVERLKTLGPLALDVLERVSEDPEASPDVRLEAARAILDSGKQAEDLGRKLAASDVGAAAASH